MAFCIKCGNQIPDDSAFAHPVDNPTGSIQKEQADNASSNF